MARRKRSAEEHKQTNDELWAFVRGKTIAGLDMWGNPGESGLDFDLIFTDGSRLELYGFADGLDWIMLTPEEARADDAEGSHENLL